MSRFYENHCVGCPQGCINCGNKSVLTYVCEKCGTESTNGEDWDLENDLCWDCREDKEEEEE